MTYPHVMSELETLRLVCEGRSLARYGDGEFNLAVGGRAKAQSAHVGLSDRLRAILADSGDCLVGIPNIHSQTPKAAFWSKYQNQAAPLLSDRTYGSAFVTRPDSAPWIDTPEFWAALESLWVGKSVTLVRGSGRSLTPDDLHGACVTEIVAPRDDAFSGYDALLERIGTPETALLCLGPTATVLAVDLCARGVHAIDLGHIGVFLRHHRMGLPMAMTAEEHAA